MKASLSNYHQSPRKVRLVADSIRGKSVVEAERVLTFAPQYAAHGLKKLLDSAIANVRNQGLSTDALFIKKIAVDKGVVGKRGRPFGRGRSGIIRKTMSHVVLELESRAPVAKKVRAAKSASATPKTKSAKKTVKKSASTEISGETQ